MDLSQIASHKLVDQMTKNLPQVHNFNPIRSQVQGTLVYHKKSLSNCHFSPRFYIVQNLLILYDLQNREVYFLVLNPYELYFDHEYNEVILVIVQIHIYYSGSLKCYEYGYTS